MWLDPGRSIEPPPARPVVGRRLSVADLVTRNSAGPPAGRRLTDGWDRQTQTRRSTKHFVTATAASTS